MTSFTVESWIWYAVVICMVAARFTARLLHFKSVLRLQAEDFLMLFLTCLYTILIAFLNVDETVSTNLIDPTHPPDLTPHEIAQRTWGSKTVLLVEQCMCAVQWGTKVCLLILYWRLTQNLKQNIVVKLVAGYVLVTYVVMEILYFGVWCRPFHDYWKTPVYNNVQCTTALHHLITNLAFNLSSDLMIMSVPLPLMLKAHLPFQKKLLLVFPFTLGLFTIICSILSKHLSFTQPFSAYWVFWYCRESSTAMIVTNMPYTWGLFRRVFKLKSFFGDSTVDQAQGTAQVKSLHGVPMNPLGSVDSHRGLRQSSQATQVGGQRRKSWWKLSSNGKFKSQVSGLEEEGRADHEMPGWQSGADVKKKQASVAAAGASSNSSSDGSVAKAPTSGTAVALDKLYPLDDDDEDMDVTDVTRRRYEG